MGQGAYKKAGQFFALFILIGVTFPSYGGDHGSTPTERVPSRTQGGQATACLTKAVRNSVEKLVSSGNPSDKVRENRRVLFEKITTDAPGVSERNTIPELKNLFETQPNALKSALSLMLKPEMGLDREKRRVVAESFELELVPFKATPDVVEKAKKEVIARLASHLDGQVITSLNDNPNFDALVNKLLELTQEEEFVLQSNKINSLTREVVEL